MRNASSSASLSGVVDGVLATQISVFANRSVSVRNPGFPGYEDNTRMEWIFEGPPNTRIRLNIA